MDYRAEILPPPIAPKGDWHAYYRDHLTTAEQAVAVVKSGDLVSFTGGREPLALGMALTARITELEDITVYIPTPGRDFAWYDPSWQELATVQYLMNLPVVDEVANARIADCVPSGYLAMRDWVDDMGKPDVLLVEVSEPDHNGFCSFGASLWDKRRMVKEAKVALAEVNRNLIRTFGENFVHITEFDAFVEHTPTGAAPASADLLGREPKGFPAYAGPIAKLVSTLIHDGDTLQIGVGTASEPVALLGGLDRKNDLGWHSEATPKGILRLVLEGNINGSRKTLHRGVAVACSIGGGTKHEMDFVHMNPMFALYRNEYVEHPAIISAHDNMVAVNNALAVDLCGQVTAENIGRQIYSAAGGQTAFALGATLSDGGRSITCLPSVTNSGISRIVPMLKEGTAVTVPRSVVDYVVTEHGIAHLRGRSYRERSEALIAIAHPDHRDMLREQARKMFWPS